LFIHPQGNNWLPGKRDLTRFANIMPPIGLCAIAAYLEREGFETAILDGYARPRTPDQMAIEALKFEPDLVGFSVTTAGFLDGHDIGEAIRKVRPEVPFVFGGVHVSALRERLLERFSLIDYAVTGEGEPPMTQLLQGGFEDPGSVRGLLYRAGGEVRHGGERINLLEMDELPFPAYERLPGFPKAYRLAIFNYGKAPATSTVTSRGCPYTCSYCDRSVYKRSFRFNSAAYIYDHMRYLRDRFGIRHVTFYDDLFTYNRPRVVELCEMLAARPLGVTFSCDLRVNHVDDELVRLLRAAGCFQVAFGIESGDESILKRHRRDPRLTRFHEVASSLKKARIRVKGLFMMGLPGEDEAAIRRSMDLALSLPLDEVNVAKFTPFPGAPLYRNVRAFGTFEEDWRKMNCMNFVFVPKDLTRERLEQLYSEFILRFFNRVSIWWGYTTMLWRSPHSVYTFFRYSPAFVAFGLGTAFEALRGRFRRHGAAPDMAAASRPSESPGSSDS
jgi:radical SAM superfamily enzyme YgiQ (UPF0313 family)